MLRARNRFVQGYNAQAAVSEDHVIVAADVSNIGSDSPGAAEGEAVPPRT